MQLPYFYERQILQGQTLLTLGEETSRHCIQVLRMQEADQLELTDGAGNLHTVSIAKADKRNMVVKVTQSRFFSQPEKKITIAISLLKNTSRFEWFLEKATEIGVNRILPLRCTRTERQNFRGARLQNILVAAMLQSRQVWLPFLAEPASLLTTLQGDPNRQKMVAYCGEAEKNEVQTIPVKEDATLYIGPEGDFTPEEIELAISHGAIPVSLGKNRLRSETAGIVAATLLINR